MSKAQRPALRDESAQSRYRRVSTRMWNDHKVRALGHPDAHPMYLFMYLLTNPATTGVPGLFRARDIALASELGWHLADFREAFDALEQQGMAHADWSAGLVWLPNAVKHDAPASPNVVVSWGKLIRNEMPECGLLLRAVTRIREHIETLFVRPEGFLEAFDRALPPTFTEGLAKAFPEGSGKDSADLPERLPRRIAKGFPEGETQDDAVIVTECERSHAQADTRLNADRESLSGRIREGFGKDSSDLRESLPRTPTPDTRHRRSSLRSDSAAPQAALEPSALRSTDARARQATPDADPEGPAHPPALRAREEQAMGEPAPSGRPEQPTQVDSVAVPERPALGGADHGPHEGAEDEAPDPEIEAQLARLADTWTSRPAEVRLAGKGPPPLRREYPSVADYEAARQAWLGGAA